MTPIQAARRGFTLVELLVVMAVTVALSALALMLLPGIANSDNTLKGAAEVQATCKIAQGMAASSRLPRGVRFLTQGGTISTEMQYLEAPPVMVADPLVLQAKATDPTGLNGPRVEFLYTLGTGANAGTVTSRQCRIIGLTPDQMSQVGIGATLVLPTIGSFSRINTPLGTAAGNPAGALANNEVVLEVYPDIAMGAGTTFRTYHFGVYGAPVPLLAEPTVPLPSGIAVDLTISTPQGTTGLNYDILFAPSGQTITSTATATSTGVPGNTGVFLWVRDTTKVPDMSPITRPPAPAGWTFDMTKFRKGGEQQIVGIRNGFIGAAPVMWPDVSTGSYPTGNNPYTFAIQKLN